MDKTYLSDVERLLEKESVRGTLSNIALCFGVSYEEAEKAFKEVAVKLERDSKPKSTNADFFNACQSPKKEIEG